MPRRRRHHHVQTQQPHRLRTAFTRVRMVDITLVAICTGLVAWALAALKVQRPVSAFALSFVVSSLIVVLAKLVETRQSRAHYRAKLRVWNSVTTHVRDSLRIISVASARGADGGSSPSSNAPVPSSASDSSGCSSSHSSPISSPRAAAVPQLPNTDVPPTTPTHAATPPTSDQVSAKDVRQSSAATRTDELLGITASFPVALTHHLLRTRALPHTPLVDLLPAAYLLSLKRTEARVRFAAAHAGPSGSGSSPLFRDRSATQGDDDWEEVGGNGGGNGNGTANANGNGGKPPGSPSKTASSGGVAITQTPGKKSNLHAPYPANLPLALLRLMEAYILGLGELPADQGGWSERQVTRTLENVTALNASLVDAETVFTKPPPVISISLRAAVNVILIYFPLWLATKWSPTPASAIAAVFTFFTQLWLEFYLTEPDPTSPAHPLKILEATSLQQSLDTCMPLARYYRSRLVARLGPDCNEVAELDSRSGRRDEWMPTFS